MGMSCLDNMVMLIKLMKTILV